MKNIVLFGAGKSATCLINYLSVVCHENDWLLTVADTDIEMLNKKLSGLHAVRSAAVNVRHSEERRRLIENADLVISLLPPELHILIARGCLASFKNLLTASYVDANVRSLQKEIEDKNLLFLCEMGLDPGIDHMSAMVLIDRIHEAGGMISSFRSHTGGLVAPENDDNPWHYKISWNPRNVIRAGSAGAVFKEKGLVTEIAYEHIFENTGTVRNQEAGTYAYYPNRDSLAYIPLYGLHEAETFMRTTLRHPDFCRGWKGLVAAGLTDDSLPVVDAVKTIADWSRTLVRYIDDFNKPLFDFLGLFENDPLPPQHATSADILQHLVERKLKMKDTDRDLIVMLHELDYTVNKKEYHVKSSLVVKGEDHLRTAMARTVGLPLGISARLILEDKLQLKGLHIPIIPEIYQPVLKELNVQGIRFTDTVS